jgi:ABC-type Fe3+ transport system permease subunit
MHHLQLYIIERQAAFGASIILVLVSGVVVVIIVIVLAHHRFRRKKSSSSPKLSLPFGPALFWFLFWVWWCLCLPVWWLLCLYKNRKMTTY